MILVLFMQIGKSFRQTPIAFEMRRKYRIGMLVSRQARADRSQPRNSAESGPRARMKRTLLDTAVTLMQGGSIPSVSDVAEAADVSRATAYRYFPSQAALIQAAVGEALGPILDWSSESTDAGERVSELVAFAYPRIDAFEAMHRATLLLSLDQWTRRAAGTLGEEERIFRGHRRKLLVAAVEPLRRRLDRKAFDRLTQSLSLIFGTEAFVVLKDIWQLDGDQARQVALWAAHALVKAATEDSAPVRRQNSAKGGGSRKTASRPSRKLN